MCDALIRIKSEKGKKKFWNPDWCTALSFVKMIVMRPVAKAFFSTLRIDSQKDNNRMKVTSIFIGQKLIRESFLIPIIIDQFAHYCV